MAFPRKLLAPGEDIVLETHPNWSILVPRVALFLLIVAGCVAVIVVWTSAPLWTGWVLLAIAGVFLLSVLAKIAVWRSSSLVLTNRRVVYRTGVLRRLGREIPLDRVQDVTYCQNIVERLVGAGSLTIQSAGAGGDEPFPDIRHPAAVQSLINRLISPPAQGYGAGGYPPQGGAYQQPPYQQAQYPYPQAQYPPQPQYQQPQQPQYPQAAEQPPHAPQPQPQAYPQQPMASEQPMASQQPPPQYAQQPQAPQPYVQAPASGPTAAPGQAGAAAGSFQSSPSEELQRLDELLHLGVITEAEYQAKRRELLQGP